MLSYHNGSGTRAVYLVCYYAPTVFNGTEFLSLMSVLIIVLVPVRPMEMVL